MGPISANKSPPPHEEGLIKHHRTYHQGLNLPFSIPLPKAHNAHCIKEEQSSLKCFYCQARQSSVRCPCAEWLLSFLSRLLGYPYSCCSTSVLLSRIEQGCAPSLGFLSSGEKKKRKVLAVWISYEHLVWHFLAWHFCESRCCWVLLGGFLVLFVFIKNYERIPVIFLPAPGEAEESSSEFILETVKHHPKGWRP